METTSEIASRLPIIAAAEMPECWMERLDGEDRMLICAHRRTGARRCALMHGRTGRMARGAVRDPELFGRHLDVVTLQAVVELKPREAEERGGARLVPMGTLERVDDGLALELVQRHGGRRPHRFGCPGGRIGSAVAEWRGERR